MHDRRNGKTPYGSSTTHLSTKEGLVKSFPSTQSDITCMPGKQAVIVQNIQDCHMKHEILPENGNHQDTFWSGVRSA